MELLLGPNGRSTTLLGMMEVINKSAIIIRAVLALTKVSTIYIISIASYNIILLSYIFSITMSRGSSTVMCIKYS